MNKAIIIIPHYNRWDLTHARIWELYKHEKENIKYILVIDNGSTDSQTKGGLNWWADFRLNTGFDIRAHHIEKNIGFLKACNVGLDYMKDEEPNTPIVLLSNDVIIRGKFIEQIQSVLENYDKALIGGVIYIQDTGWNTFEEKTYPYLEGWLLSTTLKNWIELGGGFDTRYAPHIFEDIDLSTTAISLGYELFPLNNINLHHLAGQTITYNPERDELTKINQQKFFEKWNKDE